MQNEEVEPAAKSDSKKAESNPAVDYFAGVNFSKLEVRIEDMFKSGVHFGHHKSRRNPKMSEYIFATKNDINIFDLEKTKAKLDEAMRFLTGVAAAGEEILFVGTRKQAKKIVEVAALKCEMPFVTERWLGGTFTNFSVISIRTKYLRDGLENMEKGEYAKYTKFERMKKAEELERMERRMGGIKNMRKLPGAIFVSSIIEDNLAIKEAQSLHIPIVALADSNTNPTGIDYLIPSNEDAVSALRLMMAYMTKAILEGKAKKVAPQPAEEKKN
ncbi:MAG: 30S ribosomal protein S2 [Parcubacteria group bacterium]